MCLLSEFSSNPNSTCIICRISVCDLSRTDMLICSKAALQRRRWCNFTIRSSSEWVNDGALNWAQGTNGSCSWIHIWVALVLCKACTTTSQVFYSSSGSNSPQWSFIHSWLSINHFILVRIEVNPEPMPGTLGVCGSSSIQDAGALLPSKYLTKKVYLNISSHYL